LRVFLQRLQEADLLLEVEETLSPRFELADIIARVPERTLLFNRVEGYEWRVAANLLATRRHLALALGVAPESIRQALAEALKEPEAPRVKPYDPSLWEVHSDPDLTRIPVLTHYPGEAGPYLTTAIVAARYPGRKGYNLSIHRMLPISKNKVAVRVVPRHLHQILDEAGGEVEVAVLVGVPPQVMVAASLQPPYGVSEYDVANRLTGGRLTLVEAEGVEAAIPAGTELVLEGTLSAKELAEEGPFVDLTGTYDAVRRQPTITFHRAHIRRDPVYHALLPGGPEQVLLMSLPQELKLWEALGRVVPRVRGVNLTSGGLGYFHAVVSIEKQTDGDGKNAIMACFGASHALKLVVVVDSDVDPYDLEAVEWALATRFQADRGLVVVEGARGSSLDPSSAKQGVTAKLGLDATLPVSGDRGPFIRARTQASERSRQVGESLARRLKG
jgi:UbiD family decarboxylase